MGFSTGYSGLSGSDAMFSIGASKNSIGAASRAKKLAALRAKAAARKADSESKETPEPSNAVQKPTEKKKVEQRIFGRVTGVVDGDTIDVLTHDKETIRIRLEGIDAPEKSQAFGTAAKTALSTAVFSKPVMVIVNGKDKYKRTLGTIHANGIDVNKAMVSDGFAWHYKKYNSDQSLAAAEKFAQEGRKGLWRDPNPVPPWDWRNK